MNDLAAGFIGFVIVATGLFAWLHFALRRHTKQMWKEAQLKPRIMESIRRWVEDDIPPPGM